MAGVASGLALNRRNASATVASIIRNAIIEGRLQPGQRLKPEALAAQLGTSRTPVREALFILEPEGLVDASPYKGVRVRSYELEDLDDAYELRAMLEGLAARRAASRITEQQVRELRRSCVRFERLAVRDDVLELVKENIFFHSKILEAAGSPRLTTMVRSVIQLPLVYKSYFWCSDGQKLASESYHERVTDALAAGDSELAERLMREHVLSAREFLLDELGPKLAAVTEVGA